MYEGDWIDGNKCGQGKQIDEYGIKYWGEWKDNKREGFGKLKLEDGDYYEGNFQKGIKTGSGKEVFKNGDRYEGNYLANKFHGKGNFTLIQENISGRMVRSTKGSSFTGFVQGKENGDQAKQLVRLINMRESTKMTKRMDMDNTVGQMDQNMKDFSKMI